MLQVNRTWINLPHDAAIGGVPDVLNQSPAVARVLSYAESGGECPRVHPHRVMEPRCFYTDLLLSHLF